MDNQTIKGKWTEFKGEFQNMWGKISGDDLERTKGNVKAIGGILQQKYGELKDEARTKFDQLVSKYSEKAADETEGAKENVKDAVRGDRDVPSDIRH